MSEDKRPDLRTASCHLCLTIQEMMLHNSSSAIGLLSGAGKRANMLLTSCSLAAVFLIDNLFGLQMWLQ
eukprot:6251782-Ditylum_brightwellii.AAC.1